MSPLILIAMLLDHFVFHRAMWGFIPQTARDIYFYTVLMSTPHVLASSFSFFDAEYFEHYQRQMALPLALIIVGCLLIPLLTGHDIFFLILVTWNMMHYMGQQFGVAKMFADFPNRSLRVLHWIGVVNSAIFYLAIYTPTFHGIELRPYVLSFALIMLIPIMGIGARIAWSVNNQARLFLGAIYCEFLVSVLAFYLNYALFVVLAPTLVHAVTALIFYSAHDQNRALENRNVIYRAWMRLGWPRVMMVPMIAVLVGVPLSLSNEQWWVSTFLVICGAIHYYTESIIWKRGTPHRKYLSVKE